MLESLGCTVEVAGNGLEAVMRIKDAPWTFDFVLMDLRMPIMDGIDATIQACRPTSARACSACK